MQDGSNVDWLDITTALADPGMGGPGGRPHGPKMGVFFCVST